LESKPWAVNVPVKVHGVTVNPVRTLLFTFYLAIVARTKGKQGDIIFADPIEGVVVIPQDKLDATLELLPKLTSADDKVKEEVEKEMSVKEAFAKHREA